MPLCIFRFNLKNNEAAEQNSIKDSLERSSKTQNQILVIKERWVVREDWRPPREQGEDQGQEEGDLAHGEGDQD